MAAGMQSRVEENVAARKRKKKNIIGQSATLLSRLSKVQYNGLKLQITFKHANNFL